MGKKMTNRAIEYILAIRYSQIVDDREFEKMKEIMTDDFVMTGAGYNFRSVADFIIQLDGLNQYSATFHLVGNQFGEWKNNKYQGETYCVASHIYANDGEEMKLDMGIRYADTIVKDGDNYKFSQRIFNLIWTQDLPTKSKK